jgi:hypothetical protein
MWIELLRSKNEALSCLKKVKARAETELEGKLKGIRTDRGGEFNSNLGSSTTPPLHICHNRMELWREETRL